MKPMIAIVFVSMLFASHSFAATQGAHEHGVAQLDIALDKQFVMLRLESPAANIVGFEHQPRTQSDQQTLQNAKRVFQRQQVFHFIGNKQCQMEEISIETSLENSHHDGHADFVVEYRFSCATDQISGIRTDLFELFPGIENVRVQFIKGTLQGASRLTRTKPTVEF